ncbi:unnamed protein product, partial [Laminaria digitata]
MSANVRTSSSSSSWQTDLHAPVYNILSYISLVSSHLQYCLFPTSSVPSLPFAPQIRGHIASTPSPSPPRCMPLFLSREGFSPFCPRRLTSMYVGAFCSQLLHKKPPPSGGLDFAKSTIVGTRLCHQT